MSTLICSQLMQAILLLRGKRSIKELINTFGTFSKYSGFKLNHEKCEISSIGVLKSVKVVVCEMKCIICVMIPLKLLESTFHTTRKSEMKNFF